MAITLLYRQTRVAMCKQPDHKRAALRSLWLTLAFGRAAYTGLFIRLQKLLVEDAPRLIVEQLQNASRQLPAILKDLADCCVL